MMALLLDTMSTLRAQAKVFLLHNYILIAFCTVVTVENMGLDKYDMSEKRHQKSLYE